MRTLGIIGGTSWISTVDYYRLLNELTHERLGGSHAARMILYSVNFQEIKILLDANDWKSITVIFSDIARKLKGAGAEGILLAANTPHLIADEIQQAAGLPLIHIAEATANQMKKEGIRKAALLGTKFTMESSFFRDKLSASGIETILPNESQRKTIHYSILEEMTKGLFTQETKSFYLQLIDRFSAEGAEAVIYACTEIPILLKEENISIRSFDTTEIHCRAAVDFLLK